jgi:hypothetical protein
MGRSVTFISPHVPAHIVELLGTPPLLKGEDPKQYQALFAELARTVKPADIIEWLWVRDILDLTWDIIRYRRIKASWIRDNELESPNLSIQRGYQCRMSKFEAATSAFASLSLLEQTQASAELRRNNALNEIESRRASLGQALRQASDQVIEAEAIPAFGKAS